MKIAYFDTIAGISGDMTLGAFISAGLPPDELMREIGKLRLHGVELRPSHIVRNGITAVRLEVSIGAPEGKHRTLKDIQDLIQGSSLSSRVKTDAERIFDVVAKAEAKVHDTTLERVHFHEVGALDSIVDIVGAAVCLELLGIDRVYSSAVKMGSGGFIDTEHGRLPLPGPAAVEILKGYPIVLTDIPYELTTPTGAAIIRATSSGVLAAERFNVERIGYGAGSREIPGVPNLLRVMIGLLDDSSGESLFVVEANIDDMNPEIIPFVVERLLGAGASDAWMVPVIMKKGRSGSILTALSTGSMLDQVVNIFLSETTTIGVRVKEVSRRTLPRQERRVKTSFGLVRVKVIIAEGQERLVPEFEECRRIALDRKMTLLSVYRTLEREFGGG